MSNGRKAFASKSSDSVAGLRFLVVDDHKFSRHITIEALKWLNATNITEAGDATEAIAALQGASALDRKTAASVALAKRLELSDDRLFGQGKFDCVITDFNMRPLNGLHLLRAIRTGEAKCARDTPVLLLTGFSDDALIASALDLDVNAFVLKPISRQAFNEKLGRVLMRPVVPKSVEAYKAVELPDADDLTDFPVEAKWQECESETSPEREPDLTDRPIETVKLSEIMTQDPSSGASILGEDLVLGEDACGPNGMILIHRGTKLTPILLEKLNDLHQIGMMPDNLKVFRWIKRNS